MQPRARTASQDYAFHAAQSGVLEGQRNVSG
jgi:hypothetical protein